ncbi:SRPBCC family protein [Bacillus salitolerans]|uniref:SRPBCC family protein n=1 Tax=Bacillus salitolerans TaxID=1437434 RepID=A0ABW4LQE1_9BACI
MVNLTKLKILSPKDVIFEAFIDPEKMSNYWFSSGSGRLKTGETITWFYKEYEAEVVIHVVDVEESEKIVFKWGPPNLERTVTISIIEVDQTTSIVEVMEEGFHETGDQLLREMVDNKEGWVYMLSCLKVYLEHGINDLRANIVR